ncbi:MAG: hypothetical protein KY466_17215, partial [Gemmatimonadetes bacterium]|nr:hypothetical protein [Gemmatimonadota bacterium]
MIPEGVEREDGWRCFKVESPFEFDLASVENEVNADLDDDLFAEFSGQPVLLAQGSVVTPRFPAAQGEPRSVGEVLEAPDEWTDESVTVTAEVVRVLSPNLYLIRGEDEGSEMAMIDATGSVTANAAAEADTIQVTGPVAFFDLATVEAQAGVDLD